MDLGRARYRQAHRLPPANWDKAAFVIGLLAVLFVLALGLPVQ